MINYRSLGISLDITNRKSLFPLLSLKQIQARLVKMCKLLSVVCIVAQ